MLTFATMSLQRGLGLTFLVMSGLVLFVAWVFWKINPPKF